ncbi:MAG: biopolymer transporter ExbD [Polyangiaceae bacterium]|nr:biopolymer transporter ExbD [Polyangiaceae bacterium]
MSLSNVSSEGRGRAVDAEINMVPMIDLLVCTITFLILTAVWSSWSRLAASAAVPGPADCAGCAPPPRPSVHVTVGDERFTVAWKLGAAVERTYDVPRVPVVQGEGRRARVSYPALALALARDASAPEHAAQTRAVVHTDHTTRFAELAATMDAVSRPTRDGRPAYDLSLAAE